MANIPLLDQDRAGGNSPEPIDQFKEGGFAAAAAAEQGNCFASMNLERNAGENGLR